MWHCFYEVSRLFVSQASGGYFVSNIFRTVLQILVSHIVVFVTPPGRYWYPMLLCSIHRLANFGIPSHVTVFDTPFGRYWYPMLLYVSRYLGDFITPRFWVGFALLCSIWKIIVCLLFFVKETMAPYLFTSRGHCRE